MKKVNISIDSQDYEVTFTSPLTANAIKAEVEGLGFDWKDSEVFIPNHPERGRYLYKASGYITVQAGG